MRTWSKYQKAIFDYVATRDTSAVIEARAGSGKSTVITQLTEIIPKNRKVLVSAFNASTREDLLKKVKRPGVNVQTFHQMGYRAVLRAWGPLTIDKDRQRTLIAAVIPGGRLAPEGAMGDLRKLVSLAMARLATTDEQLMDIMDVYECAPREHQDVERYLTWAKLVLEKSKEKSSVISYDDQVYLPVALDLGMQRYDDILIDEAQDCNPLQLELIRKSLKPGGRIIAVGDPQQAIYGFRGADLDTMDRIKQEFNADVLPLSVCYRCPTKVIELANNIVPDLEPAPGALTGSVQTVNEAAMLDEVRSGDLIISRSNAPLVATLLNLLKRGKRAFIMGRDDSAALIAFVNKIGGNTLTEFYARMNTYVNAETQRLTAAEKEQQVEALLDKQEMLIALGDGLATCEALTARIYSVFGDGSASAGAITLSSVHKAKGLEFPRVWMLESTFRMRSAEDENLYYVAVTRSQLSLFLVQTPGTNGRVPESIAASWDPDAFHDVKTERVQHG